LSSLLHLQVHCHYACPPLNRRKQFHARSREFARSGTLWVGLMSPISRLIHTRRSLTVDQRKRYINSVQCLLNKAPITKKTFPVVTSRYEDFVALHANASAAGRDLSNGFGLRPGVEDGIHFTGTFLPWHRYVIWVYESTLRDECGWDMGQPCMPSVFDRAG
jgi:hypothetical protein